jgi:hypothetical protein
LQQPPPLGSGLPPRACRFFLSTVYTHYWVFAHVTPTFDHNRRIISYHSNRRVPERKAVQTVAGLYRTLRHEELKHSDSHAGMNSALGLLVNLLKEKGMEYDELVWTL